MTERRLVPVSAAAAAFVRARPPKSASAFRTISEVADLLDVPQHVLRFWETRFAQIRPLKRAGGRRYYRPEDVELLRRIRELLYRDGYTIKGVQKLLRDNGRDHGEGDDDPVDGVDLDGTDSLRTEPAAEAPATPDLQMPTERAVDAVAVTGFRGHCDAAHQALSALIDELELIRDELAELRGKR